MSFRHGISRDIQAKRERDAANERVRKIAQIENVVGLARRGQISDAKGLEVIQQIIDGDAARIVRIGEEHRPDITTGG